MSKGAAYTQDGKKVKNIMRRFSLDEISAVDRGAQERALVVIMKRDDEQGLFSGTGVSVPALMNGVTEKLKIDPEVLSKELADLLTSSEDAHQHGVSIETYDGEPRIYLSHAAGESGESHSHDVVVQNGEFVLSENMGHTHTLDADMVQRMLMTMMIERKRAPEKSGNPADENGNNQPSEDIDMADKSAGNPADNTVVIKGLEDTVATQKAQLDDLNALVNLPAEHRGHYDILPDADKAAFLHSTATARESVMTKAAEVNPVVFTASDGIEFRKSDDPRMVAMAQKFDAQSAELAEKRLEVEQAEFTKRAETELVLLPGEVLHKVALLRQLSKITDEETRKGAEKMLLDASKVFALALDTRGVSVGSPTTKSDAQGAFFAKAAEIQKDKGVSAEKAQEMYLDTPEGAQAYAAYQQERKARNANVPNTN